MNGEKMGPAALCKCGKGLSYKECCGKADFEPEELGFKIDNISEDIEVIQQQVAQKIKEAREQGDLSENAEYDAAKEEQRDIELRIEEIDKILKNAELVTDDDIDSSVISIGCTVKIKDLEYDEEMEYKLVGSTEANSLKGKISNESPVGKALIGAKKGHTVMVETPAGLLKYKILEITKN